MAADGVHSAWFDDIKVVWIEPMTAVTAKTATGQAHLEVPNPRCWPQVAQTR